MKVSVKRLLFLPVSSAKGMGEYVRSVCIATEISSLRPDIELWFGLNKNAAYTQDCPFNVRLLSDTPTRVSREVVSLIDCVNPDLVVFDASGRARQLGYCKKKGIKTVFIAQHARKLSRGLSWRRLKNTDLILVAQPERLMGEPGTIKSLWLKLLRKSPPVYVGPIFNEATKAVSGAYLNSLNLTDSNYVLVSAGGGGNTVRIRGEAINAMTLFVAAATKLAATKNYTFVLVLGRNFNGGILDTPPSNVKIIDHCDPQQFNALLTNASGALLSGGSALLQGIACGIKRIVAVPVANDQAERIRICASAYGIEACRADLSEIVAALETLFDRDKGTAISGGDKLSNGLNGAALAILGLLDSGKKK